MAGELCKIVVMDGCARFAEQEAVLPPLLPIQLQDHGPLPVTEDAVPELQRPVAGTVEKLPPLAEPHCPFTGTGFCTFTLKSISVEVPPDCPAGTEKAMTAIVAVPLVRWVVSTGIEKMPFDGVTSEPIFA